MSRLKYEAERHEILNKYGSYGSDVDSMLQLVEAITLVS